MSICSSSPRTKTSLSRYQRCLNISLLGAGQDFPEGEVDPGGQHPPAWGQAVVPVQVGGVVHEEQAAVGQLQGDPGCARHPSLPTAIAAPEHEIAAGSEGHGGDGAAGNQLLLIVPVLPDVVQAVFVPVHSMALIAGLGCYAGCEQKCEFYHQLGQGSYLC